MKLQFITLPAIYEVSIKTPEQLEIEKMTGEEEPPVEETTLTMFRVDQIHAHSSLMYKSPSGECRMITIMWAFGYRYHIDLSYEKFKHVFELAIKEFNKQELI